MPAIDYEFYKEKQFSGGKHPFDYKPTYLIIDVN